MKYLKRKGKLKGKVTITYTPAGGTAKSITRSDTFKYKRKKKKKR